MAILLGTDAMLILSEVVGFKKPDRRPPNMHTFFIAPETANLVASLRLSLFHI